MNENEKDMTTPVEGMEEDYLNTIKTLKETTVSRDDYAKLKEENKRLLETVVNGGSYEHTQPVPQKRSAAEVRKELFSDDADNFTNIKFATLALELRESVMDEGGIDPFVPQGSRIDATDEDYATAEKVANAFQHCLDIADGNESVFLRELDRITVDNAPIALRGRNRK